MGILKSHAEEAPFGFAFDRGCFHVFDSDEDRTKFAEHVDRHLGDDGLWLSLVVSADEKRDSPRPTTANCQTNCERRRAYFEILSLVSSHFETTLPIPPRAWVCLMRKRRVEE